MNALDTENLLFFFCKTVAFVNVFIGNLINAMFQDISKNAFGWFLKCEFF